ncbi:hypothetical protein, partial [Cupriavidus sp. SK-3]|uniref:hypothetical protein n=1 Tax=Cupriavidus sp. SK-3 TaxID=1470558 RepID=UPI001F19022E
DVVWAVPNDAPRIQAEQFQSTGKGIVELVGIVDGISHLGDVSTVTVSNETWKQALVLSVPERTLHRAGVEVGGSLAVRIGAAGTLLTG